MIEALTTIAGIAVLSWFAWLFVVALFRGGGSKSDPNHHVGEV